MKIWTAAIEFGTMPTMRRLKTSGGGGLFRLREKYLILLGAVLLVSICYSAFIFLPDVPELKGEFVRKAFKDAWEADPKDFVVPPPRFHHEESDSNRSPAKNVLIHERNDIEDPHLEEDKRRLWEKINQAQIPRPVLENAKKGNKGDSGIRVSFGGGGGAQTNSDDSTTTVPDDVNAQRRQTIKNVSIFFLLGFKITIFLVSDDDFGLGRIREIRLGCQ